MQLPVIERFVFLLAILIYVLPTTGAAQVTACNLSNTAMDVQVAQQVEGFEADEWSTSPPFRIQPKQCAVLVSKIEYQTYYLRYNFINDYRPLFPNSRKFCMSLRGLGVESAEPPCIPGQAALDFFPIDTSNRKYYRADLSCNGCQGDPGDTLRASGVVIAPTENSEFAQLEGKPAVFKVSGESWQSDLEWSKGNTGVWGETNCVDEYVATYPKCAASGGRSCLMAIAEQSARDNDCANTMKLALITQCHNDAATQRIQTAGLFQVCQYLGPPQRQAPTSPPSQPVATASPPAQIYYVSKVFECVKINDPNVHSSCKVEHRSSVSCDDATNGLERDVAARGNVCQRCTRGTFDGTRTTTGESRWVQDGICRVEW
jgi:Protein of unknown function (DUF1036)